MSPRRTSGRSGSSRRGDRSRRFTPRRTPDDNVRVAAAWVVERTLASSAPVSSFLRGALERFDERDQGLLRELVLGTLRWLRRIDDILAQASNRPLEEIEPVLLSPLRVGAYQLLLLDRIPAYAVVDEAVEQAGYLTHKGGASFVNAVLRRIGRQSRLADWPVGGDDETSRMALQWSHPEFLVADWVAAFGEERTRRLLEANNQPKPFHLLGFRDRGGREKLAEDLIDEGLEVAPSALSPLGLIVLQGNPMATEAFRRGDCYVQDEASQLAAVIPPPKSGERILDVAAAPGGKAFSILGWEPEARVVLGDIDLARLLTVRENLVRLGRNLSIVVSDAGSPSVRGTFDRVVVDLPCSGTGTLRKHPELKWRLSPAELERLARLGRRFLEGVAPLVRPDGLLVAITCSISRADNEGVVEPFLEHSPDFEPLSLEGRLEVPIDRSIEAPGRWRLLPDRDHDGFTVHVLRRRSP